MNSPQVDRWIAEARRRRLLILLFLLGVAVGIALGYNLVTLHQLLQLASERAAEAFVVMILLALGVRP
ncbi:hypothetical protein [Deinococcus navajonensis]|uniref:Uncharacterized protein n=1 Tax=Deinococcus navajonensis TaxID=309884 RepID=A0ABV8XGD2_9DEIO